MKTATLPAIRVEPELRERIAQVLQGDESLSAFIEASVREAVRRRDAQAQFIARGLASREEVRITGKTFTVDEVMAELQAKLDNAKAQVKRRAHSVRLSNPAQ
jgi:predicted transcriptional regulator